MPAPSPALPRAAISLAVRRRILAALLCGLVLAPAAHAQERTLHVVAPWDIRGLDPVRSGFVFQRLSIVETLVVPDREGHPRPGLSASWTTSEDGLDWRFRVRGGAMFHDGTPVTPGAVANALNLVRQSPASALRLIPTDGFQADGEAVTIHLTRPFAVLPAYLADSTAVVLAPVCYDEAGHVQRVVGSGPYRVSRIDGTLVVESDAVKPVGEGGPAIQHVQYRAVPDGETRARMAEAGDADVSFNLQPVAADRLRRNGQDILRLPIPRARFVALNTTLPGLSDPAVRKALSLAIDRDGAARTILRNPASAADQLLPPFLAEWRNTTVEKLHFDPDEARRLLDAAGWRPGADGIRTRDGKRLSFELFAYASRPELPPLAEAIQAQWKDVGVEAKIRLGDPEEIPPMHNDGTLQASMVVRNYGILPDPIGTLADDFVASSTVGYGPVGWRSAAIEAAVAGYMASADPVRRAGWRQEITGILQTELPVIPLSWYEQVVAVSRRVVGTVIDPFEATYGIADMRWAQ